MKHTLLSKPLSARLMDKVLPKESEREIQMRLDFEAAKFRASDADQLFAPDTVGLKQRKMK